MKTQQNEIIVIHEAIQEKIKWQLDVKGFKTLPLCVCVCVCVCVCIQQEYLDQRFDSLTEQVTESNESIRRLQDDLQRDVCFR